MTDPICNCKAEHWQPHAHYCPVLLHVREQFRKSGEPAVAPPTGTTMTIDIINSAADATMSPDEREAFDKFSDDTKQRLLNQILKRAATRDAQSDNSQEARYIVVGYGESDYPMASFANNADQLLDAVLGMIYTTPSDACKDTREEYRRDLADEDEWCAKVWRTEFELGGIVVYDTGEHAALSDHAATRDAPDDFVDIVFDGPPSHESGRFVEVENARRESINFGKWVKRDDGYWVLRIAASVPKGDGND